MPKAKELRPFVERLITIAKRGVAAGEANGKALSARRLVLADIPDKDIVGKLFDTLAPRFADRPGGYTRILRVGYRRGDSAEVAQVELVGSEYNPKAAEEKAAKEEAKPKAKGLGERLRSTASRVRGGKGEQGGAKAQAGGQTKGAGRKVTTPRKAGGS
jgi:ribosomal protein L17